MLKLLGTSRAAIGFRSWQVRPPRPSLTIVCKQTFALVDGGPAALADEAAPCSAGDHHDDDPEQSLRGDDDLALFKPRGEWLLVGSCRPPRPTTTAAVTVRIGAASKGLAIFGDRLMERGGPSPPAIFAEMPLRWERSFGGPGIPQNPLGCGVAAIEGAAGKRVPLPNIEDPRALISGPGSRPSPVGFAPIHPTWRPRADLVGTYDALWQRTRWPWLPADFQWEHFNAAPIDQRIAGYWRGDEEIVLHNLVAGAPALRTRLPGIRPRLLLAPAGAPPEALIELRMSLDTITIDSDAGQILCCWRGLHELVHDDLRELAALFAVDDPIDAPRSIAAIAREYRALLEAAAADARGFELEAPAIDAGAPIEPAAAEADTRAPTRDDLLRLRAMYLDAGLAPPAELARRLDAAEPIPQAPAVPPRGPTRDPAVAAGGRAIAVDLLARGASLAGRDLSDADLSDLDLAGHDLRGAILQGADLSRAKLDAADLSRAVLVGATLDGARIERAILDAADLSSASARGLRGAEIRLMNAVLTGIDLTGADLARADLRAADLSGADLRGADLEAIRAAEADLAGASLAGAILRGADLQGASLVGASLPELVLTGVDLRDARADAASLVGADLRGSRAVGAHLQGADLSRANLSQVPLGGADLRDATLVDARLTGADLREARLAGAQLRGASLLRAQAMAADFTGADLRGADLRGACLQGAEVWKAQLGGAHLDQADLRRTKLAEAQGGRR